MDSYLPELDWIAEWLENSIKLNHFIQRDDSLHPVLKSKMQKVGIGGDHGDNISKHSYRRLVLITIGVPSNPNFSRIRLIKYRSAEKCRSPALSVNTMNVGGRTLPWVM
jgi:hypothetical protein